MIMRKTITLLAGPENEMERRIAAFSLFSASKVRIKREAGVAENQRDQRVGLNAQSRRGRGEQRHFGIPPDPDYVSKGIF